MQQILNSANVNSSLMQIGTNRIFHSYLINMLPPNNNAYFPNSGHIFTQALAMLALIFAKKYQCNLSNGWENLVQKYNLIMDDTLNSQK